ncbi:MAG: hypothetical protein ACYC0V_02065 [Armatimonadota bacterium]
MQNTNLLGLFFGIVGVAYLSFLAFGVYEAYLNRDKTNIRDEADLRFVKRCTLPAIISSGFILIGVEGYKMFGDLVYCWLLFCAAIMLICFIIDLCTPLPPPE